MPFDEIFAMVVANCNYNLIQLQLLNGLRVVNTLNRKQQLLKNLLLGISHVFIIFAHLDCVTLLDIFTFVF